MTTSERAGVAEKRPVVLAVCLLSLAALSWAGNYVVGRSVVGMVPPGNLAVGRWLVAFLVLVPLAYPHFRRDWPVLVERWRYVVFMGIVGGAMFGTLQYAGLQYTTATNAGLIGATTPVLIALAGAILFGDRLSGRQKIGLVLSLMGAVVIAAKGDMANLAGLQLNIGDLMILATLIGWAIYSAMLRTKPAVHWTSFTLVIFAVALLANVPIAMLELGAGRTLVLSWPIPLAILYTGLMASVVGVIAWNRGVDIIGSQRAGLFLNLVPIMSVFLAHIFLGERLEAYHGVACALVFAGLWLAAARRNA